jgi:hypothetical protein
MSRSNIAAYCADTFACASKLNDLGCHAIRGNVAGQFANEADDCASGFDEGSECDVLAMRSYALSNAQTTAEPTVSLPPTVETAPR